MNTWLLQVAGFVALVIDILVGGTLVYSYLGTLVSVIFVFAFVGSYIAIILGPLAATTYNSRQ
jgi:hypothetical protein